jgi:hypothetical protein
MAADRAPSDARPFLPLTASPKNRLRQKVRGGGPKARESAEQHGQNLLRQIEDFQRIIDNQTASRPADLPPLPDEAQVIIEGKRLLPEQLSSLGLNPIEERDGGILVSIAPDVTLPALVSKAEGYISQRTDSGNPRYGGVIAPIEKIRPAGREDKLGERLAALIEAGQLSPDQPIWVEIELAGGQSESGTQNRQEFNDYLRHFSGDLPPYAAQVVTATGNFLVEADYSLHRVLLPGRAVFDLLDDSRAHWVLSIDLVPQIEERLPPLTAGANLEPPVLPALPADAPRVVIIDSGLADDHPLFRDGQGRTIVGRQQSFLPEAVAAARLTEDEIDHGHGTAVASVVAYGSLAELGHNPAAAVAPKFWLETAKILAPARRLEPEYESGSLQLHPQQFPKALMREIVDAFHRPLPQQCKLFNLGLGTTPHPLASIANWAEEIDNLTAQNDLLFVTATGNLSPAEIARLQPVEGDYPDYLLDPRARLTGPAQAYHALSVGALAPPAATLRRDSGLAPAGQPAPFSRAGLLKFGPVKPDVVEFGGNLSRDLTAALESAILVADRNYASGESPSPLGFQIGTELAAAKVTHLAGRIQAQHPQASANLIRALIVNSAGWPQSFVEHLHNTPDEATLSKEARLLLLRTCGYGVPQPDKALSANSRCLVFVAEEQFSWSKDDKNSTGRYPAKVSFFTIRFEPDDLFNLPPATRLRVSVTLAYNPGVRKTQRRRYQAVDVRWDLRRRDEASEEFREKWLAEVNDSEEEVDAATIKQTERSKSRAWPWELKPVLNPGGSVRRGSLIRDWFEIYAHDLPPTLDLVTVALVAPWRRPPESLAQRYALVVSVETLTPDLPLYDAIRVRTGED